MAKLHCRYCEGEFSSLSAYDRHLLPQTGPEDQPPIRPVCVGERDGQPFIDPNRLRKQALGVEAARRMREASRLVPGR